MTSAGSGEPCACFISRMDHVERERDRTVSERAPCTRRARVPHAEQDELTGRVWCLQARHTSSAVLPRSEEYARRNGAPGKLKHSRHGANRMSVIRQCGLAVRVSTLPTLCLLAVLVVVPVASARSAATIVSHRYRYSIELPGALTGWSVERAMSNLTGSAKNGDIHSPLTDVFTGLRTERLYILASRPNQSSLRKWAQFVISIRPTPECGPAHSLPKTSLAAAPAVAFSWTCSGREGMMVAALHAGRGYFLLVSSLTTGSHASEVGAFDAARRSFRFLGT